MNLKGSKKGYVGGFSMEEGKDKIMYNTILKELYLHELPLETEGFWQLHFLSNSIKESLLLTHPGRILKQELMLFCDFLG